MVMYGRIFWVGWKEDKVNKFTTEGRNAKENEIWDHISTLANYRKNFFCHYNR